MSLYGPRSVLSPSLDPCYFIILWSQWMLLSQFYIDHTHPKRKDLGTLIVADVLVNLVYLMQQSLIDAEKSGDQLPSTYTMPAHLHEEAKMIYRTRCFGVSFEQVVATAKAAASASNSKVHAQALQQLANASGEFFSGTTNEATTGMHSLPQLAVTKQQGFSIQAYYSTSSGIKFKPGYLASTPGVSPAAAQLMKCSHIPPLLSNSLHCFISRCYIGVRGEHGFLRHSRLDNGLHYLSTTELPSGPAPVYSVI